MNFLRTYARSGNSRLRACTLHVSAVFFLLLPVQIHAQTLTTSQYQEDFEAGEVRSQIAEADRSEFVNLHTLVDIDAHSGSACEQWIFSSKRTRTDRRVHIPIPPSLVFDELKTSLWVRTNCQKLRFLAKVKFPHQTDPRTGQMLEVDFPGTLYTEYGKWQELTLGFTKAEVNRRLVMTRSLLSGTAIASSIDDREIYIDELELIFDVASGWSMLQLDELRHGPVIKAKSIHLPPTNSGQLQSRVVITDDRVMKDGQPFFPLFTLYHDESLEQIASTGVNMIWIEDFADRALLQAIEQSGLGILAKPPQLSLADAVLERQGIASFEDWSQPVWAWMLGFSIPTDDVRYIQGWADKVREADHLFGRPILADVIGKQRDFHRCVDFVGSSKFVMHTQLSAQQQSDILKQSCNAALPGKPMFTFVQTEASPAWLDYRIQKERVPIIEPEQILHQGYAAIAAGYKGVGFWKQIDFDEKTSGLDERIHAIRLFALHCRILEPFLATGRVVDDISVRLDSSFPIQTVGAINPLRSRWDQPLQQTGAIQSTTTSDIRASVIKSDNGWLILPVWYEQDEQYVPGPQSVDGIRMLLRADVTQAWEVTPTGISQANLDLARVPGGTEIHLKRFDQQTAIIITSQPAVVDRINQTCRQVRDESTRSMLALAEKKFHRVRSVHEELKVLAPLNENVDLSLRLAFDEMERAKAELSAGHTADAFQFAQKSLQYVRMLQRSYWEAAVKDLPTPMASPDATSFQTLPDHWRLVHAISQQRQRPQKLMPGGDFQSEQVIYKDWLQDIQPETPHRVELQTEPDGNRFLQLQLDSAASSVSKLTLTGPSMAVQEGDVLIVSARVKYSPRSNSSANELLVYDTLLGSQGAVHQLTSTAGWETVEFIRNVNQDRDARILLELRGTGVAAVDDIQVYRIHMSPE